jgi:hypothetical protein
MNEVRMAPFKSMRLEIAGMGIIFYSPFSASAIVEGENYLKRCFWNKDFVEKQALAGKIVGVCTGSSGVYLLDFFWGYPPADVRSQYTRALRLGVEVRDRKLCIRDLFDMEEWHPQCPPEQVTDLDDGFYHITLLSRMPPSGSLGDDQEILVYLNKLPEMPKLYYDGVPALICR